MFAFPGVQAMGSQFTKMYGTFAWWTPVLAIALATMSPGLAIAQVDQEAASADSKSIEELLRELDAEVAQVRRRAVYELGKQQPQAAEVVKRLLAGLNDADPQFRRGAVWSLGQIARYRDWAVPALMKVLAEDADAKVRWEAVKSLGELGADAKEAVPAIAGVVRGGRGTLGVAPFQPTRQMQPLRANVLVRSDAIRALGKIGSDEAVPLLIGLLLKAEKELAADGMPYFLLSVEALGRIGKNDPSVMSALARGSRLAGSSANASKIRQAADLARQRIEQATLGEDDDR